MRVAVALALLAGTLLAGCAKTDAGPVHTVDVTVKRYDYAPGSTEPIVVAKGETVVLRIRSEDVTHGFAITEYGIQKEIPPGTTVEVRFVADKAGDFTIYCTVFCGSGHPQHKGTLHVA